MNPTTLCLLTALLTQTPAEPGVTPQPIPAAPVKTAPNATPAAARPAADDEIRERLERARLRYRLLCEDLPQRRKAWREQFDALRRRIDEPAPLPVDPAGDATPPASLPPVPLKPAAREPAASGPAPQSATPVSSLIQPAGYDDLANELERLANQASVLAPRLRTAPVPPTAGCPAAGGSATACPLLTRP